MNWLNSPYSYQKDQLRIDVSNLLVSLQLEIFLKIALLVRLAFYLFNIIELYRITEDVTNNVIT